MYTDDDLDMAVEQGIFTDKAVKKFRKLTSNNKPSTTSVDEDFRLIGGFNDIFTVIGCALLLFSSKWLIGSTTDNDNYGLFAFAILSWGLAEYFVGKRKMAFPAIFLLLSFVISVYFAVSSLFPADSKMASSIAAAVATVAACLHWWRFQVPITIAVGTASVVVFVFYTNINYLAESNTVLLVSLFICGMLTFAFAMFWDISDRGRVTRRSDVAFWLHLLSAPLIIHPVFSSLGVLEGNENLTSMAIVLLTYVLMILISILIDRRPFMISSLGYVIYALYSLFDTFGNVGHSFALTGIVIGTALLVLSAYWKRVRAVLVSKLPNTLTHYLPHVTVDA